MEKIEHIKQSVVKIICGSCTGSGFYNGDIGAIVTNHHVVDGERTVAVELPGGEKLVGHVLTVNPQKDIAFVSVGRALDLPSLSVENRPLKQQEPVFALGYPYDLPFTVTRGIVSSTDHVDCELRYIQTDAAINPGNSGGPLVNENGEVVGMNTMMYRDAQNIGFALPAEYLAEEVQMFQEDGVTEGFHVRCPSCAGLIAEPVEYCENCGVKLDAGLFEERQLNFVEQFVERRLAAAGIDPVLARKGSPEFWTYYRGSSLVRVFTYRDAFLFSAAPLVKLPRKNLVELFTYVLSDPVWPYQFTMSNDVIHLSYRSHLADLNDPEQRERIGDELVGLGARADDLDNHLVETFGCPWATQSRQPA